MSFTHTILSQWASGNRVIQASNEFTGDGQTSRDIPVPDSSTDLEVELSLDVSEIQSIFILSDQDVTLETNDGTTPADTLNLKAGVPYVWHVDNNSTNVFTTDITALFLTNSSGSAARVQIEVVHDSTP